MSQHLEFNRKPSCNLKQPLFKPTALRRNHSYASISPPLILNQSQESSIIRSTPTWSNPFPFPLVLAPTVYIITESISRGRLLSKDNWKSDADSDACGEPSCAVSFNVLRRRHHCRRCGDVFCSSHSSNSMPLSTCRSNIDSIFRSSLFTTYTHKSSLTTTTTETVQARVCDACYYSTPTNSSAATSPTSSGFYLSDTKDLISTSTGPYSSSTSTSSSPNSPRQIRPLHHRTSSSSHSSVSPLHSSSSFDFRRRTSSISSASMNAVGSSSLDVSLSSSSSRLRNRSPSGSIRGPVTVFRSLRECVMNEVESERGQDDDEEEGESMNGSRDLKRKEEMEGNNNGLSRVGGYSYQPSWATF